MTKPVLAREMPDGSRMYYHPVTGEIVPSVTGVRDVAIAKPQLIQWAATTGAKYAVENWDELHEMTNIEKVQAIAFAHRRQADAAAAKGDNVHDLIDAWSKGIAMDVPKGVKGQVEQFSSFMLDHKPTFLETEVTLWSRQHQYAGTADWIAEIGGVVVLGDNKTGRKVYPEVGLQLSALAHCDFIIRPDGTEEAIPPIQALMVLHIRPRSYKLIKVIEDDANWSAFLAARTIYRWIKESNPLEEQ